MPNSTLKTSTPPAAKQASETVTWDAELPQLGLRQRGQTRSWIVQWRSEGRSRKQTLGRIEDISCEEARKLAGAVLSEVRLNNAPLRSPSIAEFGERYLADMEQSWKLKTRKASSQALNNQIVPYLGTTHLDKLSREDVLAWMGALPYSPGSVNRALAVLSGMMRHAEILGIRSPGSNPCKGLRRRKSSFTATYLSEAQWARLGASLKELRDTHPRRIACIQFLALTGCRKSEALGLQWDMIDGSHCLLPDSKSGPKAIWLGQPAKKLLASLPRLNHYVFGNEKSPLGEQGLDRVWREVRKHAQLDGARLHDLRHSFASVAINAGLDLRVVGGLLGHCDLSTTEGYAHLEDKTIRAASQRVGSHLERLVDTRAKRRVDSKDIFHKFRTSPLSIADFCQMHCLDVETFRTELVAWREATTKGGAKS
ncbi:tyrosine-type recombinase/integrase [uncultured Tateyamaria sp.]|uniref:tyrosine-type recombinase/integrase n=1 Tax=uncultured Tateyamaria sp. TaxID=455651 RepID=UPI002613A0AB|nr:tyrosine-type recombinase/integrase [uncultured Tateyamaria sp.]